MKSPQRRQDLVQRVWGVHCTLLQVVLQLLTAPTAADSSSYAFLLTVCVCCAFAAGWCGRCWLQAVWVRQVQTLGFVGVAVARQASGRMWMVLLQVDDVTEGMGAALAAHAALLRPLLLQGEAMLPPSALAELCCCTTPIHCLKAVMSWVAQDIAGSSSSC